MKKSTEREDVIARQEGRGLVSDNGDGESQALCEARECGVRPFTLQEAGFMSGMACVSGGLRYLLVGGLVCLACLISVPSAHGEENGGQEEQEVTVSNVVVAQHGALLRVTYDLETSDGKPAHVVASFSEDSGETFPRSVRSASGDINKEVAPGSGRWFARDFHRDGVSGLVESARVRVQGGLHPGMEREFGGIVFCWIPAGSFMMGRYPGEQDSYDDEAPGHEVTISQGFWMSKYEITQAQWEAVMGSNPSYFKGPNRPVERVSWNDIREAGGFLEQLNAAHPGHGVFRLPSEAEWEYAYRAGTTTRFYWGDDPDNTEIGDYAWYRANSGWQTHDVGQKLPNAWGLHDMSGNVWEWCEDDWHYNYEGAPADGSAWVDSPRGRYRLVRGGSWHDSASYCRAAYRFSNVPGGGRNLGFRVVLASD